MSSEYRPKMSESGSFTITRPDVIPLHTWTSSFNGDILRDDLNSGYWDRVTPYFTHLKPPALQAIFPPIVQKFFEDGSGG